MRAVYCRSYGATPVVEEGAAPRPGRNQVLVRQQVSSIGAGDALMMAGRPWVFRPVFSALLRPAILGRDVAGVVEAVGEDVEHVPIGARVVGEAGAAWAERVVVSVSALALVPDGVGLREAATLPVAAVTALQGLRAGGVGAGSRVLVIGASGSVGHFAVQIGRLLGARVAGVCSAGKAERVRGYGAEQVLPYETSDYTATGATWDVVFDLVGDRSVGACLDLLAPGGRYVNSVGTNGGSWLGPIPRLLGVAVRSLFDRRLVVLTTRPDPDDLATLLGWLEAGQLVPWIEEEVDLQGATEAVQRVLRGQVRGRCVVRVSPAG